MKMGLRFGAAVLAVFMLAGASQAAVINGTFAGTVTSGFAKGNFGYSYDVGADLTGQAITGTFSYDSARLGGPCASSQSFMGSYYFGCFVSNSGMTITQTINGQTETFHGSPSAVPGLAFNTTKSGLLLYDLAGDTVNLGTMAMIGSPATVYTEHEAGIAVLLDAGGVGDAGNSVFSYAGGAGDSPNHGYMIGGQKFLSNQSKIYQVTAGFLTQQSEYTFSISSFALAPVPEPTTWAMMVLGFGLLGFAARRRVAAFA